VEKQKTETAHLLTTAEGGLFNQRELALFWSKVQKSDGCWLWQGTLDKDSYGRLNLSGKAWGAHRIMMLLHGFDIEGLLVRHSCHNPPCVNPKHLAAGTHTDNVQDSVRDNRYASGESHGCAKLTEKQVREIRAKYVRYKYTEKMLGEEYGVCKSTIGYIMRGKLWQ